MKQQHQGQQVQRQQSLEEHVPAPAAALLVQCGKGQPVDQLLLPAVIGAQALLQRLEGVPNLSTRRLDVTRTEEVVAAARVANADAFIRHLPHGYATPLSERGSNLSQGQRQLLAIARAALANPRLLILDEATSALDTHSESNILSNMQQILRGRTAVVIAHRLSTIMSADKILVLYNGSIV